MTLWTISVHVSYVCPAQSKQRCFPCASQRETVKLKKLKEVPLVLFSIFAQWPRYSHFLIFC